MAHSIFLREFIEEIVRTQGAALAGTIPPPTTESIEAELCAAALRAAHEVFGTRTPIEAEIGAGLGNVHVFQCLRATEAPTDPTRELPLLAVLRHGEAFAEAREGDELRIPIRDTADRSNHSAIEALEAGLGPLLPLPLHSPPLWEALTHELNATLLRYFPAPRFEPGTLGAMLEAQSGWTDGLCARAGEFELCIERSFLRFIRIRVTSGWYEYGFVTVVRHRGVEILRGAERRDMVRWANPRADGKLVYLGPLVHGDNDGIVSSWGELPTGETARETVLEVLQELVDKLDAGEGLHDYNGLRALLPATLRPPRADGLWAWTCAAMKRELLGHRCETGGVRFELCDVCPPLLGLMSFGDTGINVSAQLEDGRRGQGDYINAGALGHEALELRGPESDEELRDLGAIFAAYRDWLDVHLAHHVRTRGFEHALVRGYFYAFDGYFPLVDLLAQRIAWGPPPSVPVPPASELDVARAARGLRRVSSSREHVIAALEIAGWTILLEDDLAGRPFGSYCGISLLTPAGARVNVMMVDAWNPTARRVIDGDAFAFRRFTQWLRAGLERAGLDATLRYEPEDEDEEYDEDDEPIDPAIELSLRDWLLFGMPDSGDRFLIDWRAQWHVVNAVGRIDAFKGICGFTGAYLDQLQREDLPAWRQFLREVIDPRFVHTTGEALLELS